MTYCESGVELLDSADVDAHTSHPDEVASLPEKPPVLVRVLDPSQWPPLRLVR